MTTNWLKLFRGMIAVYSENYIKHVNTRCGQSAQFCKRDLNQLFDCNAEVEAGHLLAQFRYQKIK
jgi:hypothetical protein